MILSSSNQNKIKEFKSILGDSLEITQGPDLKEVAGTIDEVIIHKALDAGKGFIVEDTVLTIDNEDIVDIRWTMQNKLIPGSSSSWTVSLGYNDGEYISIYRGVVNGFIINPENKDGFGFDPYFVPDPKTSFLDNSDYDLTGLTLSELESIGLKHLFSARAFALNALKDNLFILRYKISSIKPWTGSYQND